MLWCLHGFLGRGSDWDDLRRRWPQGLPELRTPDLFASVPPDSSLPAFGTRLSRSVATEEDPRPLLLGYSLGGRLALHALLADPSCWRGAVIVSAHLGLATEGERAARRADDARWAERFRTEPWDTVLDVWNARAVFGGRSVDLDRREARYDRTALAHGLTAWSLGAQEKLDAKLAGIAVPVLWVAGGDDARYVAEGERAAKASPAIRLEIAPGAGHRVPWESPAWFADVVSEFVRQAS